jgi:hypothetical protein
MHVFGCVNKVSGVFFFNFARFVPSAAKHAWAEAKGQSRGRIRARKRAPSCEGAPLCVAGVLVAEKHSQEEIKRQSFEKSFTHFRAIQKSTAVEHTETMNV